MVPMNQSLKKTFLYTAMVLCGGFALLSLLQKDPWWPAWLAAFCIVLIVYFVLFNPKKKEEKQPELESILPDSAKDALAKGMVPQIPSPLKLKIKERLYWSDQMRTDYYNSKPHVFYLTSQRLVCLDDDFRFSHPIDQVGLLFDEDSVLVTSGKVKMRFKTASLPSMQQAWVLIHKQSRQE